MLKEQRKDILYTLYESENIVLEDGHSKKVKARHNEKKKNIENNLHENPNKQRKWSYELNRRKSQEMHDFKRREYKKINKEIDEELEMNKKTKHLSPLKVFSLKQYKKLNTENLKDEEDAEREANKKLY